MHSGSALWSGWGMKVRANEERHESVTDGSQCPSKLRAVLVVASEARDRSGLVWTGLVASSQQTLLVASFQQTLLVAFSQQMLLVASFQQTPLVAFFPNPSRG